MCYSQDDPAPILADGIVLNAAELAAVMGPLKDTCTDFLPVLRISGFIFWFYWHIADGAGLEPATWDSSIPRSNQLNYPSKNRCGVPWPTTWPSVVTGSINLDPHRKKKGAYAFQSRVKPLSKSLYRSLAAVSALLGNYAVVCRYGILQVVCGQSVRVYFFITSYPTVTFLSAGVSIQIYHLRSCLSRHTFQAQGLTRRQSYYSPFFGYCTGLSSS